jgi:predicted nucleic acid-binding protein
MARSRRPGLQHRVREAAATRYASDRPQALTGVLLDSDVIIEVLRGRSAVVQQMRALFRDGIPAYCTAISYAEIWAGLRPGESALAESFFHSCGEVVLDGAIGRRAGTYLARHARSHGLEIADALIAAAATTAGLRLWTRNRKHYPMSDVEFYVK